MKKCELVLGNVVKAYKGETEFVITSIAEEVVILDNDKEVKISTLLKNYKMVSTATETTPVEEEPEIIEEAPIVELTAGQSEAMVAEPEIVESQIEEKSEKVTQIIYGIKVSKGINQTLIWKVLKKVCENKNDEGIKIAKSLFHDYPEAFRGATRCLVSKKRINYITSLVDGLEEA